MRRQRSKFRPSKKPRFYCDENFPAPSLIKLKNFKTTHSVIDLGYQNREDEFHYQYAAQQKVILLTIDEDYLDNKRFKIDQTFGVIVLSVGQRPTAERVSQVIDKLMPLLKTFSDESIKAAKINVSLEGYIKWALKENKIKKEQVHWR